MSKVYVKKEGKFHCRKCDHPTNTRNGAYSHWKNNHKKGGKKKIASPIPNGARKEQALGPASFKTVPLHLKFCPNCGIRMPHSMNVEV